LNFFVSSCAKAHIANKESPTRKKLGVLNILLESYLLILFLNKVIEFLSKVFSLNTFDKSFFDCEMRLRDKLLECSLKI